MNRHNVPLNGLRVFEAAARLLNFTSAASELNITQAAVSQQVRVLEGQVGTRLFERLPRGLALTSAGQELLAATRPSLDNINNAINRIIGSDNQNALTISTLPSFICLVGTPDMEKQLDKKLENLYRYPLSMDGTRFSDSRKYDITGHETELYLESLPLDRNKLTVRSFSASENVVLTALSGQSTALTRLSLCVDDLEQGRLKILFGLCKPLTQSTSLVYPEFRIDDSRLLIFKEWLISEAKVFNNRMSIYYPV